MHQDEEEELEVVGGTMQVIISLTTRKHESGKTVFMVEEQWVSNEGEMHPLRTFLIAANSRDEVEQIYVEAIKETNPEAEIVRDIQLHTEAPEGIN